MAPATPRNVILQGNVLQVLRNLANNSIDCVVTSPPYWALRDYKLPPQVWGGLEDCVHEWGPTQPGGWNRRGNKGGGPESSQLSNPDRHHGIPRPAGAGQFCQSCDAWLGQLGQEPTPELYIEHLVLIFREIRRVLADHGSVWLNIGDTYYGSQSSTYGKEEHRGETDTSTGHGWKETAGLLASVQPRHHPVLKPKDLCLIPARLSIALQEDGWWVRNDHVWEKENPMPENPPDRASRNHEAVFQLTKKAWYYYDGIAVEVPATGKASGNVVAQPNRQPKRSRNRTSIPLEGKATRNLRTVMPRTSEPFGWRKCNFCKTIYDTAGSRALARNKQKQKVCRCGSTDWESHFATFPTGLARPFILAATSAGGHCSTCGSPSDRVLEEVIGVKQSQLVPTDEEGKRRKVYRTVGWTPSCTCSAPMRPGLVLDPFMGSGTTAVTSAGENRDWLGIELNPEYVELAQLRIAGGHSYNSTLEAVEAEA